MSPPKTTPSTREDEVEELGSRIAFVQSELAERTLERDRWRGVAASLERSLADATARERVLAARVDELERELRFRGPS
jgi:hypothetical protein